MPTLTIRIEIGSRRGDLARLHLAGGDNAVNRRAQIRIGDLLLVEGQGRLRGRHGGLRLLHGGLGGEDVVAAHLNLLLVGNGVLQIGLLLLKLGQRGGDVFLLVAFHRSATARPARFCRFATAHRSLSARCLNRLWRSRPAEQALVAV